MAFNPNTLSFDVPDTDTVYISNLPDGTTEAELAKHFGAMLRQCYSTMRDVDVIVRKCRAHTSEPAVDDPVYATWRGNFVADAEAKAAVARRPIR